MPGIEQVSSRNGAGAGGPWAKASQQPFDVVFDLIVVFTTLMACLRLFLVGTGPGANHLPHSTVTLFAKFLGLSTSVPLAQAV
jgi:hypothetical protein